MSSRNQRSARNRTKQNNRVSQKGGDAGGGVGTGMPWQWSNPDTPLNTVASTGVNNYGQMSAQGVAPVTVPVQAGGAFHGLYGSNGMEFGSLNAPQQVPISQQPNWNTVYGNLNNPALSPQTGGGCGCSDYQSGGGTGTYDRSDVVNGVSQATGDSKKQVSETVNRLYGASRKNFTSSQLEKVARAHASSQSGGGCGDKSKRYYF